MKDCWLLLFVVVVVVVLFGVGMSLLVMYWLTLGDANNDNRGYNNKQKVLFVLGCCWFVVCFVVVGLL